MRNSDIFTIVMGAKSRTGIAPGLSEETVDRDPVGQLRTWMEEAKRTALREASAAALATVGEGGQPSARIVLVKDVSEAGLVFFTNYGSRKARELDANPKAALVFHWDPLARQVRVEGSVQRLDASSSAAYFATRPRASQISAWISPQSRVVGSRRELEEEFLNKEHEYEGRAIPLPPFWGGYRLVPSVFEFWQGREGRLHDRLRFTRGEGGWRIERLAP